MSRQALRRILATMPTLRHSVPGQPFDIRRSELCAWLAQQPEVWHVLYAMAVDSGGMVFDPDTRTWSGIPMKPEEEKVRGRPGRPPAIDMDILEEHLRGVLAKESMRFREVLRSVQAIMPVKKSTLFTAMGRLVRSGKIGYDGTAYFLPTPGTVEVEE